MYGRVKDVKFYMSKVNLKKRKGKHNHHVFDGLLLKLEMRNKRFPNSIIQSSSELFDSENEGLSFNQEYGFYYKTENEDLFTEHLSELFSFIQHIVSKGDDIKISLHKEEVTILMKTDMKFLNDPEFSVDRSLINKSYIENVGKQINSLLFIVEVFAFGYDSIEIVDRLELKTLESIELGTNWNENFNK